jgi:hypothetical protein
MAEPFKKNSLKKTWWKFTNKKKYVEYKHILGLYKDAGRLGDFSRDKALTPTKISALAATTDVLNFSHSGNAGDIIYALPVLKKVSQLLGKPVNLYLELNRPLMISKYYAHPLGNVMLNERMAQSLIPLIAPQDYINTCDALTDQKINIDLSLFRDSGIHQDKGNIARWNFYTTGVTGDLYNPWLSVDKNTQYAETIVLARSSRYNNALIDYSFLSKYPNLAFVGVESEYKEMKKTLPALKHLPVDNFLQMAQIIAGCKVFIGNQSFPFSIAEALKVNRVLELFFASPNVVIEGPNGYDFYFQDHFEYLVDALYNNKPM